MERKERVRKVDTKKLSETNEKIFKVLQFEMQKVSSGKSDKFSIVALPKANSSASVLL
jgi:hypothetical protein